MELNFHHPGVENMARGNVDGDNNFIQESSGMEIFMRILVKPSSGGNATMLGKFKKLIRNR